MDGAVIFSRRTPVRGRQYTVAAYAAAEPTACEAAGGGI